MQLFYLKYIIWGKVCRNCMYSNWRPDLQYTQVCWVSEYLDGFLACTWSWESPWSLVWATSKLEYNRTCRFKCTVAPTSSDANLQSVKSFSLCIYNWLSWEREREREGYRNSRVSICKISTPHCTWWHLNKIRKFQATQQAVHVVLIDLVCHVWFWLSHVVPELGSCWTYSKQEWIKQFALMHKSLMFFFPLWPISVWILFCFLQLTELRQSFYHLLQDFHMHHSLKDDQLTIFYVLCSSKWALDSPPAACTAPKWKGSQYWLSCSSSLAQGAYNRPSQFLLQFALCIMWLHSEYRNSKSCEQ